MAHLHNDGHDSAQALFIHPNIGLESAARHSVVDLLNILLADEALLTVKTRCAHWNVRGPSFFVLHTLLESQYQVLNTVTGEIAERVRMLGGVAIGSLVEFLSHTRLEEHPGDIPDALRLLADQETTIRFLREDARKCSEEYQDEGTFALLVQVIRQHEKIAWKLRALIESEAITSRNQPL